MSTDVSRQTAEDAPPTGALDMKQEITDRLPGR